MTEPTRHFIHCPDAANGHHMAYWSWGDPDADHVVLCVHGLTRQGRDFDVLAQALCERAERVGDALRVVCPDVVGRGDSDWLADPMAYQVPTYAADMLTLIGHLRATKLDWVGTSMGGLIGMAVCAHLGTAGVRRLVLNDVGPTIEWQALQRIGQYLGRGGEFDSLQQAADALWAIASSFGPHTSAQWLALSRPMVKPVADGGDRLRLHYDPALALPFRLVTPEAAAQGQALMWQLYDSLALPTLLLRGADSDLLSLLTAQAMTQRGPRARLLQFAGVGHAPTLIADDQVQAVADFVLA
ncbi:MAG: alpha/beta hydrolase [Burkholderiales bacterium]|nr:alpha/beta hydrolase [Burkholderiales bacterium]